MQDRCPSGWTETTLADVSLYVGRGTSPSYVKLSVLPVVNQRCIREAGVDPTQLRFSDLGAFAAWPEERFLKPGDVLLNSTGTGTIGRAALYRGLEGFGRAAYDSHVTVIRPSAAVVPEFLLFIIRSPFAQARIRQSQIGSTNQVELSRQEFLALPILLPPLGEQRRIVERVEELTRKANEAETDLRSALDLTEGLQTTILAKAFESLATQARWTPLEACAHDERGISYGIVQTGKETEGGVPTVRAGDIKNFGIDKARLKRVSHEIASNYQRTILQGGELLVSIRGTVGSVAVASTELKSCNISREVALVPPRDGLNVKYLMYYLASPRVQSQIRGQVRGVAQSGINLQDLRQLKIPLVAAAQQRTTVKQIEIAIDNISALRSHAIQSLEHISRLNPRVLTAGLEGKLSDRDPKDEAAHIALSRVGAERHALAEVMKKRVRKSPSKVLKLTTLQLLETALSEHAQRPITTSVLRDLVARPYDEFRDALFTLLSSGRAIQRFDTGCKEMMVTSATVQ